MGRQRHGAGGRHRDGGRRKANGDRIAVPQERCAERGRHLRAEVRHPCLHSRQPLLTPSPLLSCPLICSCACASALYCCQRSGALALCTINRQSVFPASFRIIVLKSCLLRRILPLHAGSTVEAFVQMVVLLYTGVGLGALGYYWASGSNKRSEGGEGDPFVNSGVACLRSADALISSCTFASNTAAVNGAGVFQELTPGTLDSCILRANKAQVRLLLSCVVSHAQLQQEGAVAAPGGFENIYEWALPPSAW